MVTRRFLSRAVRVGLVGPLAAAAVYGAGDGLAVAGDLTPEQARGLAEVQQLVKDTVQLYKLTPSIDVVVAPWLGPSTNLQSMAGVGVVLSGGDLHVAPAFLQSPNRDVIVAYLLGHHLLKAPSQAKSLQDYEQERRRRGMDANAKAVEVLVRARHRTEAESLQAVYRWLLGRHRAGAAGQAAAREAAPCDQIRDLLGRFPQHREWTATLECAP